MPQVHHIAFECLCEIRAIPSSVADRITPHTLLIGWRLSVVGLSPVVPSGLRNLEVSYHIRELLKNRPSRWLLDRIGRDRTSLKPPSCLFRFCRGQFPRSLPGRRARCPRPWSLLSHRLSKWRQTPLIMAQSSVSPSSISKIGPTLSRSSAFTDLTKSKTRLVLSTVPLSVESRANHFSNS